MQELNVYGCYSSEIAQRELSSSGAFFPLLARYFIDELDGIIYGVAMTDDCYEAEYIRVTNVTDLAKVQGSKYIQAKLGNTFTMVKNDLIAGKHVLFSGTGCQVNGLLCYLKNIKVDTQNLLCLDIFCHGVPSPFIWKKYVMSFEKKGYKVKHVNFRDRSGGWACFRKKQKKGYVTYSGIFMNLYLRAFNENYTLRPSCYECPAKSVKMSDLSIGDFWGVEHGSP